MLRDCAKNHQEGLTRERLASENSDGSFTNSTKDEDASLSLVGQETPENERKEGNPMEILLNKDAKKSELETEDEGTGGWRMFKKLTKNFSKDV